MLPTPPARGVTSRIAGHLSLVARRVTSRLTVGLALTLALVLLPAPQSPAAATFILGPAHTGWLEAQLWAAHNGATPEFVGLAPIYWSLAADHGGVRPDVAYAQSAHETGYGNFGGVIDASFHNPCGMKTTAGGPNDDPNAHQPFATWEEGIAAHLDHLALYAGTPGYPRVETTDPRHFPFLMGTARTLEELGGKWAPNPAYGTGIVENYLKPMLGPQAGFDEWILLLNPNPASADATLTVERTGMGSYSTPLALPANSRTSVYVNDLFPSGEAAVKIVASAPIVAERAMYFVYRGWDGGATGEGIPLPQASWLLAEGYEAPDFDTYVEVYNPGDLTAAATVTLLKEGGGAAPVPMAIAPHGRNTLAGADVPGFASAAFSARVDSDQPVVAERSSYFRYVSPVDGTGRSGGSSSRAVGGGATSWDLAEGYSGPGFDTWVLVANPSALPAELTETYFVEDGPPVVNSYTMPAYSRHTTLAGSLPGLAGRSHSTRIESSSPVAAERAEYFGYSKLAGADGGSSAQAADSARLTWYLAEGYTGPGFDTWVLLSNPGAVDAAVRLTFMREGLAPVARDVVVGPGRRLTVDVGPIAGPVGVSTVVESMNAVPVVAERATYFDYMSPNGWLVHGGGASMGQGVASATWYFAEGYLW